MALPAIPASQPNTVSKTPRDTSLHAKLVASAAGLLHAAMNVPLFLLHSNQGSVHACEPGLAAASCMHGDEYNMLSICCQRAAAASPAVLPHTCSSCHSMLHEIQGAGGTHMGRTT
jgi:hypothetical protein